MIRVCPKRDAVCPHGVEASSHSGLVAAAAPASLATVKLTETQHSADLMSGKVTTGQKVSFSDYLKMLARAEAAADLAVIKQIATEALAAKDPS